ncbi:MAG: methionyl-tRNA formyltransferase [Hydrotalea sp.]|nr:methionyl-tRNA formyltransferase [Hydrotalea sp.]
MASDKKKIVFMGSSPFAAATLRDLYDFFADGKAELVAVYTQPPKPKHRGKNIEKTPVHEFVMEIAGAKNHPIRTPERFDEAEVQWLSALQPDLIIVVAYGLLLPAAVLSVPRIMAVNIHPSLLPRHRGATPIESALLAGDAVTGVTLIKMTAAMDAGDIIAAQQIAVADDDNRESLSQKLLNLSLAMLRDQLPILLAGEFSLQPQESQRVTYSQKIKTSDYQLHPTEEANIAIDRKIRGYYPKAFLLLPSEKGDGGKRLQILSARKHDGDDDAKDIFFADGRVLLPCHGGAMELLTVKPENKNAMAAADWWRGRRQ